MKDWKAAIRTWIRNDYNNVQRQDNKGSHTARGVGKNPWQKRDGELSQREYLERCGYPEEQIKEMLGGKAGDITIHRLTDTDRDT